ncbi:MAG: hypothetical protein OEL55_01190 [Desulfobulbaceae bacterium]|nr:hypothetical protein [Desulfobulbaceae bacterium]
MLTFKNIIAVIIVSCALLPLPVTSQAAESKLRNLQDWLYDNHQTELNGFVEMRAGVRTNRELDEKDLSIGEARLQLDLSKVMDWGTLKLKTDLVGDTVDETAIADLRELNLLFSPLDNMDVKVGRQVLTWGTGDLLFINDLFPKDWVSFFIGRDDEYLKAPSDAIKTSLFFDTANIDFVYMPTFNNSNYIDGSRLSYWNPILGRNAGRDFVFDDNQRNSFDEDDSAAMRISKNISGVEYALYGYYGFWSTPKGLDPVAMRLTYPGLAVYGGSVRATLLGGIGNFEFGYYDSLDDQDGDNPLLPNSEFRAMTGFERELGQNLTGSVQYYMEWKQDYDEYETFLPAGMKKDDEYRSLLTLRITKLLKNQTLRLSAFAYYSPTDNDSYLRAKAHYKVTDQWAVEAGGNIFLGADDHTFFGQFEDNTNIFAGLRRSF